MQGFVIQYIHEVYKSNNDITAMYNVPQSFIRVMLYKFDADQTAHRHACSIVSYSHAMRVQFVTYCIKLHVFILYMCACRNRFSRIQHHHSSICHAGNLLGILLLIGTAVLRIYTCICLRVHNSCRRKANTYRLGKTGFCIAIMSIPIVIITVLVIPFTHICRYS